ncbi:hypothetical protein ACOMHN_021828 [Nucella lapillus]
MLRWPQMSWLLTSTLRTWPWLLTSTMLQTSTMQTSWLLTSTVQTSWLLTSTMLLTSTVQTSWLLTSTVLLTSTQLARQEFFGESPSSVSPLLSVHWLLLSAFHAISTLVDAVKRQTSMTTDAKTVLILSGSKGKALHLGRLFKAEGYKVIITEHRLFSFVGASFSKYVDAFYYLPIPQEDPQGYQAGILEIVKKHNPHLLIPMDPRTVDLDIKLFSQLPKSCLPLACEAEVFQELDNKDTFMKALDTHGIRAPKTQLVNSKQETFDILKEKSKNYVLKPIGYDDVTRSKVYPHADLQELDTYLEESGVSPTRPHVIQERLEGPEMTAVCLVFNKHLIAFTAGFSDAVYQTQNHTDCQELVQWTE